MKKQITQEEFDQILEEKLQQMYAVELLFIPGFYELVSEYFTNEVIEEWESEWEDEE